MRIIFEDRRHTCMFFLGGGGGGLGGVHLGPNSTRWPSTLAHSHLLVRH